MSLTSAHAGRPADVVKNILERVRTAAGADLDHLGFGDKHSVGPNGQYIQGVPMLARAMAEWPPERPAGLLFLVPLWHPVQMAEMIGTLAAMSDVPLVIQTGIGAGEQQFAAMGSDLRRRGRETDRRIGLVAAMLRGETVDDDDLGLAGAAIAPRPSHGVEWWIGSGAAPAALDRAARLGDALYIGPGPNPSGVAALCAGYRARCTAVGRPGRVVLRRDVVLTDDGDRARAFADEAIADGYRGMERAALVAGDAASVAGEFAALADLGVEEISARVMAVPQAVAVRTIELLGDVRAELRG
jgi:alkanesulfonate monooxygenase SsuD/methylene tetrahydromethanopterin reductase-like flavin-dependent oxidoreductase (luciferase family)